MTNQCALRAFTADLREHAEQLRTGTPRMGSRKLADFRSFRYGEDDAFFPIDVHGQPWRKHRVPVSRAELAAAGYDEYSRCCKWVPQLDPWRLVYWSGRVPLWYGGIDSAERETRLSRARFLDRLAAVVASRVQSKGTRAGGSLFLGTRTGENGKRGLHCTRDASGELKGSRGER